MVAGRSSQERSAVLTTEGPPRPSARALILSPSGLPPGSPSAFWERRAQEEFSVSEEMKPQRHQLGLRPWVLLWDTAEGGSRTQGLRTGGVTPSREVYHELPPRWPTWRGRCVPCAIQDACADAPIVGMPGSWWEGPRAPCGCRRPGCIHTDCRGNEPEGCFHDLVITPGVPRQDSEWRGHHPEPGACCPCPTELDLVYL